LREGDVRSIGAATTRNFFEPSLKARAQERLQEIMSQEKARFANALPFAMEPVVYDFAINESGTCAQ
jgi:hypothetical protein